VTYVNTSAAVKADSDICCTSSNARKVIQSLGVCRVIMLPDEYLAQNVAADTSVEIISWSCHCKVHERFTAAEIRTLREQHSGVIVLAHPECPPEVVAEADVSALHPDIEFIRPCNLCPHMKRIALPKIRRALETMSHEVIIDPGVAAAAHRAVERMLAISLL
jgi:quinolinate synthase